MIAHDAASNDVLAASLWVEAVTGESIFVRSPLVTFHCRPSLSRGMVSEKPKAAQPLGVDVLRRFEHLIVTAWTAVKR